MARILIIEDEPDMRLGLEKNLTYEGYDVEMAADGESGLDRLKTESYNLILLDVMLPGIDGFDLCKKLREEGNNTPIIYLSARGQEMDKVVGLELGAEDYITKPFSLRELSARIKVVLRRQNKDDDKIKNIPRIGNALGASGLRQLLRYKIGHLRVPSFGCLLVLGWRRFPTRW